MNYEEFKQAVEDAETTLRRADRMVENIGHLLPGRLRHVSGSVLADLKRELQDFDLRTHCWKKK